jgi:L-iditol 2-dehydrogenase
VGARGEGRTIGERVVVSHHVPCYACHYCKHGNVSMCRTFKASHIDPGGFAEYIRVPALNAQYATFPVPSHLEDEEAASMVWARSASCSSRSSSSIEPG